jgi:hypothetical protein
MESCQRYPRAWLVLVYVGVVGLAMTDIVWVISTTTSLVTCKWICYNCKNADVDCFILDKEGQCYKGEQDKIFPRTRLSMNLVKLRLLRCCYYFSLYFAAMKFRG